MPNGRRSVVDADSRRQKLIQADKMETPNNRAYFKGMMKQARKRFWPDEAILNMRFGCEELSLCAIQFVRAE
jgi:hypothetical protein